MNVPVTLENTAWDFKAGKPEIALLPLACLEPHGAHLPVGTDAIIVSAIAHSVAERLSAATYLLPTWPLGASGPHLGQPGALSLEHDTLWAVVRDVVVGLHGQTIHQVAVINNHGSPMTTTTVPLGNAIVKTAVRQLNYETPGLKAIWVQPLAAARQALFEIFDSSGDDLHAGEIETSLMMHLAPDLIRNGASDAVPSYLPAHLEWSSFLRLSPSGVWGRPSQASAVKGRRALEAAVSSTVDYIERTLKALSAL